MKVAILGANPNCGNRGVNALAYSIIEILNEVLKNEKDKQIYFFESFKGTEKYISLNGVKTKVMLYPIIYSKPNKSWIYLLKKNVRKIQFWKWDVVLVINGGDSFSDIYGQQLLKKLVRDVQTWKRKANKIIFLPQTIGPFRHEESKKIALNCLKKVDTIFTRDKISFNILKKSGFSNISELIDMAFFLPYKKKQFNSQYVHVGINISSLLWHGGYTQDNQFALKCNYQETIRRLINTFLSDDTIKIHLIPHVLTDSWYEIENDYAISKIIMNEYDKDRLIVSPYFFDPCEAKSYISAMDFFIGARMHACIAAFSSGVPTVPMAYSRKFTGLFSETLCYKPICNMKEQDDDTICNTVFTHYKNRFQLKEQIDQINKTLVVERKDKLLSSLYKAFYGNNTH
ncbi:polysaccharide pyruvyl transferase family protein [uncultured Bacteroides sp.]|uniref:polysaccharide pyruvyl transferase family protein n=1 Tax=uncultured Bacteroides sp. TaxID=162156 RepID=UPI0025FB99CA|nr:polysaccharide pyruvyl transferase family protein [uncultured Bacteroides sp.]